MKATTPVMLTDPPMIMTTMTAISSPSDNPPPPVSPDGLDFWVALEEALVLEDFVGLAVEDLCVICVSAEDEAGGVSEVVSFSG